MNNQPTWSVSTVSTDLIDDVENAVVSISPELVACISGGHLKIFQVNNTRTGWVNVATLATQFPIVGNLDVIYKEASPAITTITPVYCIFFYRLANGDIGDAWYKFSTPSVVATTSLPYAAAAVGMLGVNNASGAVVALDPSRVIYQADNRLYDAWYGCPSGNMIGGWVVQPYSNVSDCAGNIIRQADGTIYYQSDKKKTLKYVTWEVTGCGGRANCTYCTSASKSTVNHAAASLSPPASPFSAAGLQAFPNPVTSIVNLSLGESENEPVTFRLSDMLGRTIMQIASKGSAQLNLQDLPNGVYLLRAHTLAAVTAIRITVQH